MALPNIAIKLQSRVGARSIFGKQLLTVLGGNVVGQLMTIAAAPFLMRAYTPDDYGIYGVYLATVSLIVVMSSLRYDAAIPVAKTRRQLFALISLSSLIPLLLASAIGGLIIAARLGGLFHLGRTELFGALCIVPFAVAASGLTNVLMAYATREMAFRSISETRIVQGLLTVGIQGILAGHGLGPLGLCLADAVGRTAGGVRLSLPLVSNFRMYPARIGLVHILAVGRRFRDYARYSAPSSALNAASLQLPVPLVAYAYGSSAAGWLSQAQRLLAAPLGLIGMAVSQVFVAHFSEKARCGSEDLRSHFTFVVKRLALFGGPAISAMALMAPFAMPFLFGESWREAGIFTLLLWPMITLQFVLSPVSPVLQLKERQRLQLLWDAGRLMLILGTFAVAVVLQQSARSFLTTYSIVMSAGYIVLFKLCSYAVGD